jgi:hypothetical protein
LTFDERGCVKFSHCCYYWWCIGKIINSLVEDVIMPIVGLLTGGVDFTQKFIALDGGHYDTLDAAKEDCRYHLW